MLHNPRIFSPQNSACFLLSFLIRKIFTLYTNGALKFKCPVLQTVKRRDYFPLLNLHYLQELPSCEVVWIYRVQWLQLRLP
jgi:hypothetical protein